MANPPITIGPFTNVPAPGSPIRSDWPQTISAWVAPLTAWIGANVAGPEVQVFPGGTIVSIGTITAPSAGNYMAWGSASVVNRSASGGAQINLNMRINGVTVGPPAAAWMTAPNELQTLPFFGLVNLAAGARTLELIGTAASGDARVGARAIHLLRVQ